MLTITTESRLSELKRYTTKEDFVDKYKKYNPETGNGVVFEESDGINVIVYYVDNYKFTDDLVNETTTFKYEPNPLSETECISKTIYKDPNKIGFISNPKLKNDIFIDRQELSILEKIYPFHYFIELVDIETYACGKYFTIFNNTEI